MFFVGARQARVIELSVQMASGMTSRVLKEINNNVNITPISAKNLGSLSHAGLTVFANRTNAAKKR